MTLRDDMEKLGFWRRVVVMLAAVLAVIALAVVTVAGWIARPFRRSDRW